MDSPLGPDDSTPESLFQRLAGNPTHADWTRFWELYCELFERVAERCVRKFAAGRPDSAILIDSIVSQVYINLRRRLPTWQYDPAKGNFRGYLFVTTKHTAWGVIHDESPHWGSYEHEEQLGENDPWKKIWNDEWEKHCVDAALRVVQSGFTKQYITCFLEHWRDGLPARETAEREDMSIDAVYQARSRVKKEFDRALHRIYREGS